MQKNLFSIGPYGLPRCFSPFTFLPMCYAASAAPAAGKRRGRRACSGNSVKDTNEILFSTSGKNKTVPGSGVAAAAAAVAVVVAVLQAATRAVGGAVAGTRSGPVLVHLPLPRALH